MRIFQKSPLINLKFLFSGQKLKSPIIFSSDPDLSKDQIDSVQVGSDVTAAAKGYF